MGVTGSARVDRSLYLSLIEKIENSRTLHGSESLRKLFRYLANHALDHPGVPLKEYQIATEVHGRPADFDPQSDSAIRVQAGRLRQKLSEYYASEGAGDPIQVEMPKGAYVLTFHPRTPEGKLQAVATDESAAFPVERRRRSRALPVAVAALSVLLIAAVAVIAWLIIERKSAALTPSTLPPPPSSLVTFWKPFASNPEEPWVIFSNGAFVGRPETGMRYFNPSQDSRPQLILDHYTGVGEVLAVHNLDRVFHRLHRQVRVKRGSLFSLDDAKNNDLIFVGSPAENLTLRDIPGTREFVFQRLDTGERKGDLAIANVHPQPGEGRYYLGSRGNTTLTEDYAVIALVKGLDPARSVLIMAGTTTIGTQAAVEFACDENSVQQLLQQLKAGSAVTPFEVLLRVKVTRGVPVETSIVALRSSN